MTNSNHTVEETVARLRELLAKVGPLPICPTWTYMAIRHAQRNMDFDVDDGFNEPDRQCGGAIAEIVNALPMLLDARASHAGEDVERTTRAATEEEAQYGLNDIWPGDPIPVLVDKFRVLPLHGDAGCDKLTDDEWRMVARAALAALSLPPSTQEALAKDRADWLLDAVACATQDRHFLRGDPEYDAVAGEAILLNGEKAIRVAIARISLPPSTHDELVEALAKCRDRFREYERSHRHKAGALAMSLGAHHGDTFAVLEKAARNAEMADMCDAALMGEKL